MHEDDGQRRVRRPDLLDRQQDAVVGLHERAAVGLACGRPEGVVLPQVGGDEFGGQLAGLPELCRLHAARGDPADSDADRRPRCGQADHGTDDAGGVPLAVRRLRGLGRLRSWCASHQTAPAEPTYRRANRPPTRVTSS